MKHSGFPDVDSFIEDSEDLSGDEDMDEEDRDRDQRDRGGSLDSSDDEHYQSDDNQLDETNQEE